MHVTIVELDTPSKDHYGGSAMMFYEEKGALEFLEEYSPGSFTIYSAVVTKTGPVEVNTWYDRARESLTSVTKQYQDLFVLMDDPGYEGLESQILEIAKSKQLDDNPADISDDSIVVAGELYENGWNITPPVIDSVALCVALDYPAPPPQKLIEVGQGRRKL